MFGAGEIVNLAASQGILGVFILLFLGLFVWVMNKTDAREKKADDREDRLMKVIESHDQMLKSISEDVVGIRKAVDELTITERVNNRAAVIDRRHRQDDRR